MSLTGIRICLLISISGTLPVDAAEPAIKVSKHTTRFTAPVNDDGSVDFAEAVNLHFEGDLKPDENSAVVLYSILGPEPDGIRLSDEFFERLGMLVPADDGEYFQGLGGWLKTENGGNAVSERYYELDRIAHSAPWQKEDAPEVAQWLDAMKPQLERLNAAVQCPGYFLPLIRSLDEDENEGLLISILFPGVYASRSLARALVRRANLAMGEERFSDARDDLILCMKLGRHVGQGAMLVERLVGIAAEVTAKQAMLKWIELAKPDRAAVQEIRRELEGMLPLPDMAESVAVGERAAFLDVASSLAFQRSNVRELLLIDGDEVTIQNVQLAAGFAIDWNLALRQGNAWYDRMAAAMRQPTRPLRQSASGQIEAELRKLAGEISDPKKWVQALVPGRAKKTITEQMSSALIALLLPAVSAAGTAADRCAQSHANLDLALALSAFHKENSEYPEKLEQLVPKFINKVPADLFVRGALKYQRTVDGYLVYSQGPNTTDDKGRWYDDDPAGDDISIRMPVPSPKDDE